MPKVKNLGNGPVSVYCGGISMAVPPGEHIESDGFTEGELKLYRAHPEAFEVSGAAVEGSGIDADEYAHLAAFKSGVAPIAHRLGIGDSAIFTQTVMDELDKGDNARIALADIAALFGSDEVNSDNVKDAVAKMLADIAARPDETTILTAIDTSEGASDLASAVALLDDANDDHWTQAGLPDISTLKTLTGGDVTRAMVDQLPTEQKRERAKLQ